MLLKDLIEHIPDKKALLVGVTETPNLIILLRIKKF